MHVVIIDWSNSLNSEMMSLNVLVHIQLMFMIMLAYDYLCQFHVQLTSFIMHFIYHMLVHASPCMIAIIGF